MALNYNRGPSLLSPGEGVGYHLRRMTMDVVDPLDKPTIGEGGTASGGARATSVPALTILYHPDLDRVGERALLADLVDGKRALLSRTSPAFAQPGKAQGKPLSDEHVSRSAICLAPSDGGGVRLELNESPMRVVIQGRRAREDVVVTAAQLRRGVVLSLSNRVVLLLHLVAAFQPVFDIARAVGDKFGIIGASDGILRVLWEASTVADRKMTVLLRGETGCGKEVVAHAIHLLSSRPPEKFVAVNMGAIHPSLAAGELFGWERGAFTGATERRAGVFERASEGTLFLDEIGNAPAEVQVALLRALEYGEIQRLGAKDVLEVSVRVVAATDADLEGKIKSDSFSAALLNRIEGYSISILPLRERRDDIGRMLVHFIRQELSETNELYRIAPPKSSQEKPWLPAAIVARLCDYDWPGNVRQLRNVIRQLIVGSSGQEVLAMTQAVEELLNGEGARVGSSGHEPAPPSPPSPVVAPPPMGEDRKASPEEALPSPEDQRSNQPAPKRRAGQRKPADVTESELRAALSQHDSDFEHVSKVLRISRGSIYVLLDRFPGIPTAGRLPDDVIKRCYQECEGDMDRMAKKLGVSARALARVVKELGLKPPSRKPKK